MNVSRATAHPASHLPSLDGARGIAILLVLLHNFDVLDLAPNHTLLDTTVKQIYFIGWIGVQLFFVLSGFLITRGLLQNRGSSDYFRSFFAKRLLRIFPLYYLALLIFTVLLPLLDQALSADSNPLWLWIYLANWTIPFHSGGETLPHFWSLAVEEQFYLLWPLLLYWIPARHAGTLCLLLIGAGPVLREMMIEIGTPNDAIYHFTFCRMDALAAGAALAVWEMQRPASADARRDSLRLLGLGLLLLAAAGISSHGFQRLGDQAQVIGYSLLALAFALLTGWAMLNDATTQSSRPSFGVRLLRSSLLRRFGKYSYGIYVYHKPLHDLFGLPLLRQFGLDQNTSVVTSLLYFGLLTFTTVLMAWISWELFESYFMALKNRFERPAPSRPVQPGLSALRITP